MSPYTIDTHFFDLDWGRNLPCQGLRLTESEKRTQMGIIRRRAL